jgi:hypothetical protein
MENDYNYKKKYLKYKHKYLILKKKNQVGKGFFTDVASNLIQSQIQGQNLQGIPELQGLQSQQEMINELKQFITPDNIHIFKKLILSLTTHIFDPKFYTMLVVTIKSLLTLFGSVETANPVMALISANNALINMKQTFPKEFELLKEFFKANRQQILQIINSKYPGIFNDQRYNILIEFLL